MQSAKEIIELAKKSLPEAFTYPYDYILIPISDFKAQVNPTPFNSHMELVKNYGLKTYHEVKFQKVIIGGEIINEWEFVNIKSM